MLKHLRIFIIDDNRLFGLTLKGELQKSLEGYDYDIQLFEDGESCDAAAGKPDLVLVDYHLDGKNDKAINGLQVIEKIRKHSPETDFIMITMDEKTELFIRSKTYQIYDYITKSSSLPFKLSLTMQHWLKMKKRKNAN